MHQRTRFLIRTWSKWLAWGGGSLTGVAIFVPVFQWSFDWAWVAAGALGCLMAAAAVVLVRYIPYGPND